MEIKMIVWGYSTKTQMVKSVGIGCSHCNHQTLNVVAYKKVFDLFWIPCFPFSAQYALACPTCGTHYDISSTNIDVKTLKSSPSWKHFIGLIVFPLILGGVHVFSKIHEALDLKEAEFFRQSLQIEDKIILETDEDKKFPYVVYKVRNVSYSTINGMFSKYSYKTLDSAKNAAKYPKDGDFETKESPISRAEFDTLTNIKAIVR